MAEDLPGMIPTAEDDNRDAWAVPGTQRHREIKDAEAQRSFGESIVAGFKESALNDFGNMVEQEGELILEEQGKSFDSLPDRLSMYGALIRGQRAGEAEDYSVHYEALTTGVPSQYHDEILDEPNLAAAERASARVREQLDRASVTARQHGLTPALGMIAGGFIDADAPLMLVTGGGYKAASVARQTMRASRAVGLSPTAALRASSATVGINAGMQSGVIVGAAQASIRETADWTMVADAALQGMVMGGALNSVLKGDVQLGVRAAQDELYSRMAKDDPSLTATGEVDVRNAERINPNDYAGQELVDSTAGARQVTPTVGAPSTPVTGVADNIKDMSQMMDNWHHDSDWGSYKTAEADEWWAKVALSGAFNVTTNNWRTLYTSKSTGMNWLLGNVFESPNGMGRGRYTAAAGEEMYLRRITQEFSADAEAAAKDWSRRNASGSKLMGPSQDALSKFNREVMLEMNDRAMGRTSAGRDPAVVKAADAYDRAGATSVNIAKGDAGDMAVDGFDNIPTRSGYSPYIHNGKKLLDLERQGVVTRKAVIDAYTQAYKMAGMAATKDAHAVAKAVVDRATAKGEDVNTNVIGILSGDGREWLHTALEGSGMSKVEVEGLMRRLTGEVEEKGKESFAKTRNDLDLSQTVRTEDGSELKLVDLLDNDMHKVWQRYARQMAGSASLARVGITNKAQIEDVIQTIHAQQRAIGEELVDGDMIRAMFSHFEGGPVKGWSKMSGRLEDGVVPEAALAKRMTNLALLGKLGLAQLAETGAAIAATGLENWFTRFQMETFKKQLSTDPTLLDDLAFITGNLGEDHKMFAEHLDLDDMNATDHGAFMRGVQRMSQKGTYYQGYVSGFNTVRGYQQRIAAGAVTDKLFKTIKAESDAGFNHIRDEGMRNRIRADLGLFDDDITALFDLVDAGVIEFRTENGKTFVDRINADTWDPETRRNFGSAITRSLNQIVQKSMAGEQDAWMHTTVGSLLTHLKTFPLQAMQKQVVRNARHSDAQALNTVLYGMATAGVAIMVKDAIDGRDRSMGDTAKAAFGYSNMTGWVPMMWDPTMTILGMEGARMNQYGVHSEMTPPTVAWANKAMRLPGAAFDKVTGTADYHDNQSLKALPFANVAGLSRMFD